MSSVTERSSPTSFRRKTNLRQRFQARGVGRSEKSITTGTSVSSDDVYRNGSSAGSLSVNGPRQTGRHLVPTTRVGVPVLRTFSPDFLGKVLIGRRRRRKMSSSPLSGSLETVVLSPVSVRTLRPDDGRGRGTCHLGFELVRSRSGPPEPISDWLPGVEVQN